MKIKRNKSRAMREGGFAGVSIATIATVAGIAAAATTIAVGIYSVVSAPDQNAPGGAQPTVGGVSVPQALADANARVASDQAKLAGNENNLTAQLNKDGAAIGNLQAAVASQKTMEYIALGLAGASLVVGVALYLRKKK